MKKKELCYIVIVAVLGVSLLLSFAVEVFHLDLGGFSWIAGWVSSPIALAIGFAFALLLGKAFPDFNKTMSKKMLQYSVIGLGFGMNVDKALASGAEGMMFTIASVFGTLALGWLLGRKLLGVDTQTSYLLSSGTAICGGSAIAAVGPIIRAKAESMSVALGVVFVLNGIALFLFPTIGDALGHDDETVRHVGGYSHTRHVVGGWSRCGLRPDAPRACGSAGRKRFGGGYYHQTDTCALDCGACPCHTVLLPQATCRSRRRHKALELLRAALHNMVRRSHSV